MSRRIVCDDCGAEVALPGRPAPAPAGWVRKTGRDQCPSCVAAVVAATEKLRAAVENLRQKRPRGLCSGCDGELVLTIRGLLPRHRRNSRGGELHYVHAMFSHHPDVHVCPGVDKPPRGPA